MRCEKCALEIDSITCGECGKSVARLGPFCYLCGHRLDAGAERLDSDAGDDLDGGIDLSSGILCSDGTCIGIINGQGVCKVCGKPYMPEP